MGQGVFIGLQCYLFSLYAEFLVLIKPVNRLEILWGKVRLNCVSA